MLRSIVLLWNVGPLGEKVGSLGFLGVDLDVPESKSKGANCEIAALTLKPAE